MTQNYIIFSGDNEVKLVENTASSNLTYKVRGGKEQPSNLDKLPYLVDQFESGALPDLELSLYDESELLKRWIACYDQYLIAAGGLVLNEQNELLLIFRNGKWDLPKGKLEEGENIEQAAVREICEETGIDSVDIIKEFAKTYHTYQLSSGKRVFKETIWFLMKTGTEKQLIPQLEEGITEAIWANKNKINEACLNTYQNVKLLIDKM